MARAGNWSGIEGSEALGSYIPKYLHANLLYNARSELAAALLEQIGWPRFLQPEVATRIENVVLWLSRGNRHSKLHFDEGAPSRELG